MFRLSKAAEYAISGLLYLSMKSGGETAGIEEISRARGVPASYLAKLFQVLAKKAFIRSYRGPDGGFTLAKSPAEITILEVIEAVEGPIFLNDCLTKNGLCARDEICPVHDIWKEAQRRFLDYLKGATFEDLVNASKLKGRVLEDASS